MPTESAEEELGQVVLKLMSISKTFRALTSIELAEVGLTVGHDEFLLAMRADDAIGLSEIANRVNIRPATVTKLVDRLVEKGLVRKGLNHADVSRRWVALTPAGMEATKIIKQIHNRIETDLMACDDRPTKHEVEEVLTWIERRLLSRLSNIC